MSRRNFACFVLGLGIVFLHATANATTRTVTTASDHTIGPCTADDCTLREAIVSSLDGDSINFAASVTGTITLSQGEMLIQQSITISGPGAKVLAVSGNNVTRIFEIKKGFTASISGLTLTSGYLDNAGTTETTREGGAILNHGTLTVAECRFTVNAVRAYVVDHGTFLVAGRAMGGGLRNDYNATVVVRNCTFDFNSAQATQAWGAGFSNGGAATVINSTFSNNVLKPTDPPNSAQGGGIYNQGGNLILVNCTVLGNSYLPSGGADTVEGGGVYNYFDGTVAVQNTLIANNTAPTDGADVKGVVTSRGHNVVQTTTDSSGWIATDKIDAQASPLNLGGLVYNGGQNKTHALLAGSVAIDAGDDGLAVDPGPNRTFGDGDDVPLTTDERGYARKVGAAVDVGAFEFEPPQSGVIFTVTTIDEHDDGVCSVADCTLLEAMNLANSSASAKTIQFKAGLSGTIVNTLAPQGLAILQPLNIIGPGGGVITISGAAVSRVFRVLPGATAFFGGLTITNGKAAGDSGGGIFNDNGMATINNCTLSGNAAASGGGIYTRNGGTTNIDNSTVSGNSGNGGGVFNDSGTVNITSSTLSGNSAQFFGGGIYNFSTMTIMSSTIAGNTAGSSGGGGISNGGGTVTLKNSIVALNTSASGPDVKGALTSQGFNFIGNSKDGTITPAGLSDQIGTASAPIDPLLGSLQDNGGPTFTRALLSGSPAIDKGLASGSSYDQRDYARVDLPDIANASGGDGSDIGAFEFQGIAPTPTPTPTATATATPIPTATPAVGLVANVSTRLPVGTDDNVLIEGFIVQGPAGSTKKIIVRAIGPSLLPFGITDALANPTLELHDSSGATVATNNDWRNTQTGGLITGDQAGEISGSGVAPSNDLESAIIADLAPGSYTAVVRGVNNTTGTGVVDAYDLSGASPARLANIATRGLIQPGDKLMIAGFIIQNGPVKAVVRAIGPSLIAFGIANALPDTTLQLRDQSGVVVVENDDWKIRSDGSSQQAELEATGLQPSDDREAAFVTTLQAGQYTAQVRGKPEATGIGVVQVYFLQ